MWETPKFSHGRLVPAVLVLGLAIPNLLGYPLLPPPGFQPHVLGLPPPFSSNTKVSPKGSSSTFLTPPGFQQVVTYPPVTPRLSRRVPAARTRVPPVPVPGGGQAGGAPPAHQGRHPGGRRGVPVSGGTHRYHLPNLGRRQPHCHG